MLKQVSIQKTNRNVIKKASRYQVPIAVCKVVLSLTLLVLIVFGQTLQHDFINFDDDLYVYNNPDVSQGLSRTGITHAFTKRYVNIWLPLTMLSYQLDYELSGMDPGAFHLTNVLLHAAATVVLFLVLRSTTRAFWPSAFAAALFAVHPLRVESVAWISERKDVLCGLFFMLILGAYVHYARATDSRQTVRRYGLLLLLFVLGLLAKPMLITLPFLLLLLDFWPLNRFQAARAKQLVLEKIPLILLAGAATAVAVWTERDIATPGSDITLLWRIGNAAVSCVIYIQQLFIPVSLTPFYPHLGTDLPLWQIATSILFLTATSVLAFSCWKRFPYFAVGWFWFLGTLVPVAGIFPLWLHAHADRYTYLPQIGLLIAAAWLIKDISARWKYRTSILTIIAVLIITALCVASYIQVTIWRDSLSLWAHTLHNTSHNHIAHDHLGCALYESDKVDEAFEQFQQALRIKPTYAPAHNHLGAALAQTGNIGKAFRHFTTALEINPHYAAAHNNLGMALLGQNSLKRAVSSFQNACLLNPSSTTYHFNLALALQKQGDITAALKYFNKALTVDPAFKTAHYMIGNIYYKTGCPASAIEHYEAELQMNPDFTPARNSLAWVLSTCTNQSLRNGDLALRLAHRAVQATKSNNVTCLDTLAAAYAEVGEFLKAQNTAQQALNMAKSKNLAHDPFEQRLRLYLSRQPYHESSNRSD